LLKIALKQLRLNIVKGANFVNFKNQSKLWLLQKGKTIVYNSI
jgi:hypothetical protein